MTAKAPSKFFTKKPEESAFDSAPKEAPARKKSKLSKYRAKFGKISIVKFYVILMAVLFAGASGVALYQYHMYQESQKQVKKLQNYRETARLEQIKLIETVGKLIVLPKDETPTIATVTDREKLKGQQFFAKATNGDKILIYTRAKKAYLYNPTQNKVVEVAPVNIGKGAKPEVAGTKTAISPTQIPTPTTAVQILPTATTTPLQPTTAPVQQ